MNTATFNELRATPVSDVYVEIETERGTSKASDAALTQLAESCTTHLVTQSTAADWTEEGPYYSLRVNPWEDSTLTQLVESCDDTFKEMDLSVMEVVLTAAVGVLVFDEDTGAECPSRTLFKVTLVCGTRADSYDDEDDDNELDPELLQLFRSVPLAVSTYADEDTEPHVCHTCGNHMSDNDFQRGKMCCDHPLFHGDHDEDA